ncbi:hypothetical protein DACRYDRAFT_19816 [Dacryopinax primogenitus]|uniref:Uncharacterized protein n=1 Tax=Dacryopinax primogenitus (strain DJM 731) TaxID=1858805 RepID=M5GEB1_DACPD|nr:uncharacterized protein DACRYDRAFT_19816 [Dacryopinax primogenitus]EJU05242.1 hypothetical protein DACRYDRAFT_19816 [Dacryopinax primogenitus]
MPAQRKPEVTAEFMAYMANVLKPGSEEDNLMSIDEDEEYKYLYDEFRSEGKVDPTVMENEAKFLQSLQEGPLKPSPGHYDDEHVHVSTTAKTLTLKHWLISHPILVIDLDKVIYLRSAPDVVVNEFGVKVWGIGETGVGWTRDGHRKGASGTAYDHSFVCKYTDERLGLRAGFSVDDPLKFSAALEKAAHGITARHTYP